MRVQIRLRDRTPAFSPQDSPASTAACQVYRWLIDIHIRIRGVHLCHPGRIDATNAKG